MNITKPAAEKALRAAAPGRCHAVRIDADSTSDDKQRVMKETFREIESRTKRKQSVTLILVTE